MRGASWDGISSGNRESKPISLDLPLALPGGRLPTPQTGWKTSPLAISNLNLALLKDIGENSCHFDPLPPTMAHQATVGPPVPQALLDTPCIVHPVPTYSPCPVSSTLLY